MGLPLFVCSDQQDVELKATAKSTATSPNRTRIRRSSRSASRETRHALRAAGVRIYGAPQSRLSRANYDSLIPWGESTDVNLPEPPRSSREVERAREVRWERPANEGSHREQFEEQMISLFGSHWREGGPPTMSLLHREMEIDERWRPLEAPSSRSRRAQVVPPLPSRFDRSPERTSSHRRSPSVGDRNAPRNSFLHTGYRASNTTRLPGPRFNRPTRNLRGRSSLSRRPPAGLDGLGDRDRSLSPEVWDTLFSTMTPDPQPSSVVSSFASTAASRSAGSSSSTQMSIPEIQGEAAPDVHCDSGCEHSDVNMDEDEENLDGTARIRLRRPIWRDVRQRLSPYSLDAVRGQASGRAARLAPSSRQTSSQPLIDDSISPIDANERENRRYNVGEASRGTGRGVPLSRLLNRSEGWASGQEASEEESGADGFGQNSGGDTSGSGIGPTLSGEEDLLGMQRIVRSLARREDIPDEWWAEAGLSRTLHHEEVANH